MPAILLIHEIELFPRTIAARKKARKPSSRKL